MTDERQVPASDEHEAWVSPNQLRWWTRSAMLLGTIALLTLGAGSVWPVVIPALSPFVTLAAVLVTRAWPWFSWIGLIVFGVIAWRQRWFCRWMCPMGFCADQATWVGRRCGRRRGRWPAVGQWIALLTLMGAAVGYPLLLWLDPLALLSAAITSLTLPGNMAAWWLLAGLAAVLLLSLIWPNVWCAKICPLGGTQEAVFALGKSLRNLVRAQREARRTKTRTPIGGIRRRTVLGAIFGVVWASATLKVRKGMAAPLRPPSAVAESRFAGLCIRCGNCSRACPTQIISHEMGERGVAGLLTPQVRFQSNYCLESCNQCTVVCPSGALQPVALESKVQVVMGTPQVDMDLCLLGQDRECSHCRNHCPYEAIRLEFSQEWYTLTPVVDLDRCPGCGACEVACPTQGDKAIVVRPGRLG